MPTIHQLQRAAMNAAKRAQQAAKNALHEAERLAKAARRTAMSPTARKKLQRDLQDTVRKLGAAGKAAVVAGSAAASREMRGGRKAKALPKGRTRARAKARPRARRA